jgi:hypothetical protein
MRRVRTLIVVLSLAVTVCFIVLSLRSLQTSEALHRIQTQAVPGRAGFGVPGLWMVTRTGGSIGHDHGSLLLTQFEVFVETYPTRPSAETVEQLGTQDGWGTTSGKSGTFRFGGFGLYSAAAGPAGWRTVQIPLWFCVVLAASPALIVGRGALRRRRRRRSGRCAGCGYDLAGAKLVCPECGRDLRPPGGPVAAG